MQPNSECPSNCSSWVALGKARKTISRKNNEISTLTKIIANLKLDNSELESHRLAKQQEFNELKHELEKVKLMMAEAEIGILDKQRQLEQERFNNAIKARNTFSRLSMGLEGKEQGDDEVDGEEYGFCRYSRNTADEGIWRSELNRLDEGGRDREYRRSSSTRHMGAEMNMGEMFMGKRAKLEMKGSITRHSSWGKLELLDEPMMRPNISYKADILNTAMNTKMDIENVLSYLREENEILKTTIY